jgi:hypothetical protein
MLNGNVFCPNSSSGSMRNASKRDAQYIIPLQKNRDLWI